MDSYDDRGADSGGGSSEPGPDQRGQVAFDAGQAQEPGFRESDSRESEPCEPEPPQGSEPPRDSGPRSGIAALSLPYQIVAAVALSVIGLVACGQLAMVFLHVAPSNTVTKQHGEAVDDWIYPEFEQNWKLFAPNPLQQNIAIHVRAEIAGPDGRRTTAWMSLSGEDGKAIRGSLLPSHIHQNELRRGWDFYLGSHDNENRAIGLRGELSERYIRRIAMLRLGEHDYGGTVERIQVRSETRSVAAPAWSEEKISTRPSYRVLPWWTVTAADLPADAEGADK
ncbi:MULTISPECIES: DUF5819 family protein [unclassified Streptomyces]|uniref:DUF5819 family protein n=1 Tax=unclassified Streptomyces TaxID=2593676 RepID=UPI003815BA6A